MSTRGTRGAAQGSWGPVLLALTTWSGPTGKGGVVLGLWILSALRFLFLAGGPRDLWVYQSFRVVSLCWTLPYIWLLCWEYGVSSQFHFVGFFHTTIMLGIWGCHLIITVRKDYYNKHNWVRQGTRGNIFLKDQNVWHVGLNRFLSPTLQLIGSGFSHHMPSL